MDFLALPRRDLQALCKRNGVRANMTSAAMADALRALPKVDGIEEYVKQQPVPVPGPEEKNAGKQANPLPRGRRAAAKSSEPIEPAEEDNEEEKGNAKPQSSKEGAPALGVERRGASQRARLVPVVPQLAAMAEEALKREAKRGSAPAPVLGRRGTSRRARPSPAVAAPAAEPEVAGAEEEPREEKVEDPKRDATMDDVPALGVGHRGARGRARPAPSVAALASKVVAEEEQMAPIPRRRRVNAKGSSAEPIRLDDSDDEEKENAKPEQQQGDAQIIGVGRRGGAGRRAQAALAVAAPEVKAQEEQRPPVPRGGRVKAKSTELIRLDDKGEKQEDTKPEEEKGDAPAIGVERRGASRRTPAPSEAPATRRSSAASKAEAGDVAVEAVPNRATRQRKPTMKAAVAAAAAEEKAPRRATRTGAVMSTHLQQEVQEEPQEAVGTLDMAVEEVPIRATRQRKPTMKAAGAASTAEEKAPPRAMRRRAVMRTALQPKAQEEPQGVFSENRKAVDAPVSYRRCDAWEELEEASDPQKVDAQKQDEDQDVVTTEDKKLIEDIPAEEPPVLDQTQEEPQEPVGALVSYQRYNALHVLAKAFDPQKEELNEVDTPKQDEYQDVVIIEDEKLIEKTPAQEPSLTDQECTDNSKMQEQKVDDEKCNAPLATQEESSILGLVSMVTEQEESPILGLVSMATQEESPILDCSSNISEVAAEENDEEVYTAGEETNEKFYTAGEETNLEVNPEDGLGCQEESFDKVLHDSDNTIHLDCSSDISWNELEKAGNVTNVMPENPVALDEDGDKLNGLVISDNMSQVNVIDELIQEERRVLITVEMLQGTAGMHDEIHDDQFETVFVQPDQVVTADNLLEHGTGSEITVEENTALIVDARQQSTVTMDDDDVEVHYKTEGVHSNEQVEVVTSDKVPELELIEDVFVQANHVAVAENLPEQVIDCEIIVETTSLVVDEKQKSTVTMDEDDVEVHSKIEGVHSNEQVEVVTSDKVPELELIEDVFVQANHVAAAENLPEQVRDCEIIVETTSLVVDVKQKSTVTMDIDVTDHLETVEDVFVQANHVAAAENLPEQVRDCEIIVETTSLVVDVKQKSTVTMDIDVTDHLETVVVHADEQMEVATTDELAELTKTDDEGVKEMKTPLIVDEKQQSKFTMNGDIVDDHFKTHVALADEQKKMVATEVPEVTGTDSEIEEKTPLIVDEKNHSTVTMDGDVVFDHFKTDTAPADEQKEVTGIVTEVPDEITGTDEEVVEEKAVVITEDIPSVTHTMDVCAKENHFGIDFGHGNEQMKAITADIELEVSRVQDGGAQNEIALLDDVTDSLSKSIVTMEPSVCKNSSGKNHAEPMAVLEEKGLKVASESEDLTKLSLGQLRAKLKEKLNAKKNKEAKKRVALARVDENVCRSHAKGQQQDLNLQQH